MLSLFLGVLTDREEDLVDLLFLEYNEKFYYRALRMLGNEYDAQDAVAYAFVKIVEHIKKISRMPEDERIRYCNTIVRNAVMDILRYRRRFADNGGEEVKVPEPEIISGVEQQFFETADRDRLYRAVERLPEKDRYLIQLRYVYDMEYGKIAKLMDIEEDAARKRGQRILIKLRRLYEKVE